MKVSELRQLIREEVQNALQQPEELEIRKKILNILTHPDVVKAGYKTKINDKNEDIYGDFFNYIYSIDGPDRLAVAKLHGYDSFDKLEKLKSDLSYFFKKSY
jgi:hypothetical protein